MADTTIKLSGTYDSIEAYRILEEMREMSTDYEEIKEEAEAAVTTATAAATTAQGHANNASTYADNAQTYAGNANTSAGAAAGYASDASTAATNAATSETNASNSASAAASSESNASTSETNAAASATAAAASAAEAAATLDSYLPKSGGTLTGEIHFPNGAGSLTAFSSGVYFSGNNPRGDNSSNLILYADSNASGFMVQAGNGATRRRLIGKPDGTFTWDGQPIQTSSDKRLKTDFADVPNDVLEAWSKVEWKQFKYIADKERKGDSCRWHTGLVAQDVQDVCGDEILKYGILCHDVQEATEEQEAVDLWTVRYTEALCMEVIYLRNEIKKLHEEISKLK